MPFVFAIRVFCFMDSFTGLAVADLVLVRSMRAYTIARLTAITAHLKENCL